VNPERDPDGQRDWWNACYADDPCLFGAAPSRAGREAAKRFRREGTRRVLELGAGHGRDAIHFAREGFEVVALDYAGEAVRCLAAASEEAGLGDRVAALRHDVREPLPFPDASFDGVYAHMLLCMALDDPELEALGAEVRRVLRPNGLFVWTVRTDRDAHCGAGVRRGDELWEYGGFVVRFFSAVTVERITAGWETVAVREFEEGALPRRLVCVVLRRPERA
jgi:SAM-dependent methyltransferase